MTERITYRAQKGVIYRVLKSDDGYGIFFRLPQSGDWICSVGMGVFPSLPSAEEALARLAASMGWTSLGASVPDPTKHWRDTYERAN